jgi:uncharacterized protein YciI
MSIRSLMDDLRALILIGAEVERVGDEQLRQRQQLQDHAERLARLETAMQLAMSGRLRLPKS